MTNVDFSPLFRSTVGLDRLVDLLQNAARVQHVENWPPYDIEKTGEDRYRITMAVAGFSADELDMTKQANTLIVSGRNADTEDGKQVLHRGIATRSFQRIFHLADYVEVAGASLIDGLLSIDLVRQVPESLKPKRIPVQTQAPLPKMEEALQVEHKQAA